MSPSSALPRSVESENGPSSRTQVGPLRIIRCPSPRWCPACVLNPGGLCPKRLWFSRPARIVVFSLFERGKLQCNGQPRLRVGIAACLPKADNVLVAQNRQHGFTPEVAGPSWSVCHLSKSAVSQAKPNLDPCRIFERFFIPSGIHKLETSVKNRRKSLPGAKTADWNFQF